MYFLYMYSVLACEIDEQAVLHAQAADSLIVSRQIADMQADSHGSESHNPGG